MKRFYAFIAALAAAAFLFSGCASAPAAQRTIRLRGNDSQGYTWEYVTENDEILSEVDREYQDGNVLGTTDAPGIFLFTFEGGQPGSTRVYFHYVDKNDLQGDTPLSTVVYNVTVDGSGRITDCVPIGTFEEVEGVAKLAEVLEILKTKGQ